MLQLDTSTKATEPAPKKSPRAGGRPAGLAVSVILPCLNEEESIEQAVHECRRGLVRAGLQGEVIVSDNGSTDRSAELALAAGARVIRSNPQGYGAAYLAGLEVARGEVIVMGDADLTYPMERLGEFVALAQDHDLVIGSRFADAEAAKHIPFLNRVLGNPALSGLARLLYGGSVEDFHCGMRAVRRDALPRLDLHTPGMEFASEMVVKALRADLRIAEIPIEYRPRVGETKLNRWRDGWRHLRFLICHAPDPVLLLPGFLLAAVGLAVNLLLLLGDVYLGREWSIHTHIVGVGVLIIGLQAFSLGVLARAFSALLLSDRRGVIGRAVRWFTVDNGVAAGAVLVVLGVLAGAGVLLEWSGTGFTSLDVPHLALSGLAFTVAGVQLVLMSFFAGIIELQHGRTTVQHIEVPRVRIPEIASAPVEAAGARAADS